MILLGRRQKLYWIMRVSVFVIHRWWLVVNIKVLLHVPVFPSTSKISDYPKISRSILLFSHNFIGNSSDVCLVEYDAKFCVDEILEPGCYNKSTVSFHLHEKLQQYNSYVSTSNVWPVSLSTLYYFLLECFQYCLYSLILQYFIFLSLQHWTCAFVTRMIAIVIQRAAWFAMETIARYNTVLSQYSFRDSHILVAED